MIRTAIVSASVAAIGLMVMSTAWGAPGTTELISVNSDGYQGSQLSYWPAVSEDGQYVAFQSDAPLDPPDDNQGSDVFVRDRLNGTTERVSVSSSGQQGNGGSWEPSISGDGRYVAFTSGARNFAPGSDYGGANVFVRDRLTGSTELVSANTSGTTDNSSGGSPAISRDGRYVAFVSGASNLVANDNNGQPDVFVRDRVLGVTERVSVDSSGTEANGYSHTMATISGDGSFVAFESDATNLVAGDTNGTRDIFLRTRQAGTTERVSVNSQGTQSDGASRWAALSANGRYVLFDSSATNLVASDTNAQYDVFVRDRALGTTELVSLSNEGLQGNEESCCPSGISDNGQLISFLSLASNLVPNDNNFDCTDLGATINCMDVFVRDRLAGSTILASVSSGGVQANAHSVFTAMSADGHIVAFSSDASNLVPGDTNGTLDVFARELSPAGVGGVAELTDRTSTLASSDKDRPDARTGLRLMAYAIAGFAAVLLMGMIVRTAARR
jgi:Tol biopolymer transport system component